MDTYLGPGKQEKGKGYENCKTNCRDYSLHSHCTYCIGDRAYCIVMTWISLSNWITAICCMSMRAHHFQITLRGIKAGVSYDSTYYE